MKCDIRKFFANIDHQIFLGILKQHLDSDTLWICERVVESFETTSGKGLPLGNLTSQLFANVYLNELDQFIKHGLKGKYYLRYADDFAIFYQDKEHLTDILPKISGFLADNIKLKLHDDKVFIKTIGSGVDFLGWVHFPDHQVLRTATKRRMLRKIERSSSSETLNSYLGLLKHGNAEKLTRTVTYSAHIR